MKTKQTIIYNSNLIDNLAGTNLVVDSTAIIDASKNEEFLGFLRGLSQKDCTLITIPAVIYEVLRYARDAEKQDVLKSLIKDLNIQVTNGIEESALEGDYLRFVSVYANAALSKRDGSAGGPSFTDSLLRLVLLKGQNCAAILRRFLLGEVFVRDSAILKA